LSFGNFSAPTANCGSVVTALDLHCRVPPELGQVVRTHFTYVTTQYNLVLQRQLGE